MPFASRSFVMRTDVLLENKDNTPESTLGLAASANFRVGT